MRGTVLTYRRRGRAVFEVHVRVYGDRRGLRRAVLRQGADLSARVAGYAAAGTLRGVCARYRRKPGEVPAAVVLLNAADLGAGVVAHEMVHAGVAMVGTLCVGNPVRAWQTEERLAALVGDLCREFWSWWYEEDGR